MAGVTDAVIFDTIFWTTIIVGIWYYRQERAGIHRLLQSWGLPIAIPSDELPGDLRTLPGEPPEVEVTQARVETRPGGDLFAHVEVVARKRLAKRAMVKIGLLDPAGTPFEVPTGIRWVRFQDRQETLGGEVETPFSNLSEMRWTGVGITVPGPALPDPPRRMKVRVEVWIDGMIEAEATQDVVLTSG
jgi:hypothetical protein